VAARLPLLDVPRPAAAREFWEPADYIRCGD
jgi:hypothetical protein